MVRLRIQLIKIWVLNCSNIIRKLLSGEDEDTEWLEQIQFLSYSKLLDDRQKQDPVAGCHWDGVEIDKREIREKYDVQKEKTGLVEAC